MFSEFLKGVLKISFVQNNFSPAGDASADWHKMKGFIFETDCIRQILCGFA